jgi:cellulose synthase/poly-beta-1,6-N-acetylglucosamine synthase-like glycosyltransferase
MNYGFEQIAGLTTEWLSLLFIAASAFGSLCALGAAWATRRFIRQPASVPPIRWPDVSILKPLYGAEAQLSDNIETYFHQDYPGTIQFVFGVQDPNDSAIPVVRSLIARYPEVNIQLVVNAATHGSNRKVSNLINMAQVARHSVIVAADSDVAVGPNYLSTLAATLTQPGVGAVTCLTVVWRAAASGLGCPPWPCTIIFCQVRSLASRLAWRGHVSAPQSLYREKRYRGSEASRESPTNWLMITPSAKLCVKPD